MQEHATSNRTDLAAYRVVGLKAAVGCLLALGSSDTTVQLVPATIVNNATDSIVTLVNTFDRNVERFCSQHPEVRSILHAAPRHVASVFGDEDYDLRFEHFADPAFGTEQVFLIVRTSLSARAASRLQSQLEDSWWLDAMAGANGLVGLSVEFA